MFVQRTPRVSYGAKKGWYPTVLASGDPSDSKHVTPLEKDQSSLMNKRVEPICVYVMRLEVYCDQHSKTE